MCDISRDNGSQWHCTFCYQTHSPSMKAPLERPWRQKIVNYTVFTMDDLRFTGHRKNLGSWDCWATAICTLRSNWFRRAFVLFMSTSPSVVCAFLSSLGVSLFLPVTIGRTSTTKRIENSTAAGKLYLWLATMRLSGLMIHDHAATSPMIIINGFTGCCQQQR